MAVHCGCSLCGRRSTMSPSYLLPRWAIFTNRLELGSLHTIDMCEWWHRWRLRWVLIIDGCEWGAAIGASATGMAAMHSSQPPSMCLPGRTSPTARSQLARPSYGLGRVFDAHCSARIPDIACFGLVCARNALYQWQSEQYGGECLHASRCTSIHCPISTALPRHPLVAASSTRL